MLVEALKSLGLTGHEAQVYISNVQKGEQTGYEIANLTGIARSNVYAALASLLEKGIVYKVSEDPGPLCSDITRRIINPGSAVN